MKACSLLIVAVLCGCTKASETTDAPPVPQAGPGASPESDPPSEASSPSVAAPTAASPPTAPPDPAAPDVAPGATAAAPDSDVDEARAACDAKDDTPAGVACFVALGRKRLASDDPFGAYDLAQEALRWAGGESAPASDLAAASVKAAKLVVAHATKKYTGNTRAEARKLGPHGFAQALAARAQESKGDFTKLLDPRLGVAVVSNISGDIPRLDHVIRWPRGEHDYGAQLDAETVLEKMTRATELPTRLRVIHDDSDCETVRDAVVRPKATAFESWPDVRWDDEIRAVPEGFWLQPLADALEEVSDPDERKMLSERFAQLRTAALAISYRVYLSGVAYDFGLVDGQWYLLAIDMVDDLCG